MVTRFKSFETGRRRLKLYLSLFPLVSSVPFGMDLLNRLWSSEDAQDRGKVLPGPGGVPFLGASPQLGKYAKIWDAFTELNAEFGPLIGVQIGSRFCLVVNNADHMKEILVHKANQFSNRPDFLRFHAIFRWNRHLSVALCDWSEKQKSRRDVLYGPLHPKAGMCLQMKLFSSIEAQSCILVDELKKKDSVPFEPRNLILRALGNIFYEFFCSATFDWNDEKYLGCIDLYNEVFHELFQGFAIDFMPWLKPFYQKRLNELHTMAGRITQFTASLIKHHEDTFTDFADNPRDICDILLAYVKGSANDETDRQGRLDDLDLEVIVEDLIGGFPVVSNMILWGLYMIADESEVQEKLYEEYRTVVGCGVAGGKHKQSLIFAEATMYEILRMVCSPIIPHVANRDLQFQGFHIPKDTMVMFNTCDLNFNPSHWEQPEKFMPERFIREGAVFKPDFFLPFGTGKRSCMGDGLVRHIILLILSTICGHFYVNLGPSTPPIDFLDARGRVIMEQEPVLEFKPRN